MKEIKIGVIGVGYLGRFHAEKYAAMDGVRLVGVADPAHDSAAETAERCRTRPFSDYRDLLDKVDAVSVVVPTTAHYKVANDCLERGVDIMLEKPMTRTLAEADKLIAMAEANNRIIQVGHLERFNPAILAMEKYLFAPMFIESHRISTFKDRGTDVDVVLDLMIHDIDIVLSIVDSPLQLVHTVGVPVITPFTDIANARLIFENGCTANVTVSRISIDNQRRIRIFQPQVYISADYAKKEVMIIRRKMAMDEKGGPAEEIINLSFRKKDALAAELEDFVNNVRNHITPKVSGREGRRALAVALEIMAQIKENLEKHKDQLGKQFQGA